MNLLFAVRVLFDFLSLAWIIIYAATQCAAKGKVRKVEKERPGKIRGRRMRRGPNNGGKTPSTEEQMEYSALPPTPTVASSIKQSTKHKRTERQLQSTQKMSTENITSVQASTTQQECPTQEDDPTAPTPVAKPKKAKRKEVFFKDQDDDDTLASINSIKN
ncbi:uncharacterized protein CELE_C15H11.13 [Caenorhabditis elegans]|uniref:Uncharacterized protein n=1 Tax=Caenorhabditis elegans TaxID=6239 RepID=B1Q268_CAEEL|nr:Uncharacterized protein CELE_C15H11.13 [Caenorhabditis elegans]CAQ16172.1 Uncharacterized protein CELE_C15H11.13 [Caenorhabditis elegans]|eukprot:NP_001122851.1 Uncharacterized protein CELE_C15H11.13 [Caenorhabditis elegans]